jgi:hypothetical protein
LRRGCGVSKWSAGSTGNLGGKETRAGEGEGLEEEELAVGSEPTY